MNQKRFARHAAILLSAALAPVAHEAAAREDSMLEEIVVTARKREENLQRVPMAVMALTAQQLENFQINNITDLERMTPNVTISETSGLVAGAVSVFIRGVGSDFGFDQGVGIYIDDVYLNRTTGALLETYDIERIELLKGPQGHLYGRNTIGGAIKYVTRRPDDEVRGEINARTGEFDLRQIKGKVSGPLVDDRLYGGAGFFVRKRDGIQTNSLDGKEYWDSDFQGFRANLLANVAEQVSANLMLDYTEDNSSPQLPNRVAVDRATLAGIDFVASGANTFLAPGTGLYSEPNDKSLPSDIDRVATEFGSGFDEFQIRTGTAALTVEWEINESWSLKSISAGRWVHNTQVFDFDGSVQQFITSTFPRDADDYSQELQFNFEADALNGVFGVYYLDASLDNSGVHNPQYPRLRAIQTLDRWGLEGEETLESRSAYAALNWDFAESWQLSLGARYTEDKKDTSDVSRFDEGFFALARLRGFPPNAIVAILPGQEAVAEASPMFAGWAANSRYLARTTVESIYGDDEWGEFTPSAKLSWMLAEETMLYAGYSTGFKSGGFSTVSGFLRPYDPETLDSYTLGLKTTLADSLRLNAEVFYNDYQDKQLSTVMLDENGRLVALEDNVGEMSTSGAEIEVEWAPLEGLLLMVSGGYLDTDVDAYVLQDAAGNDLDLSEQTALGFSPEWTAQARAQYRFAIADMGHVTLGADVSYRDESYTNSPINLSDPLTLTQVQESHEIYNAIAAWSSPDESWNVSVEGMNLGDKRVLVNSYKVGPIITGGYNMPRTWALSVGYAF